LSVATGIGSAGAKSLRLPTTKHTKTQVAEMFRNR
jgi:hypothetical protein